MFRVRSLLCCTLLFALHLHSQIIPITRPNVVPSSGKPLLRMKGSPALVGGSASSLVAFSDTEYAAGTGQAVVVGDFNGDGKMDYVIADYLGSTVQTLLGTGDGTFQPALVSTSQNSQMSSAVGDFNGDGILDLVTGSQSGTVAVLLGKGDGTFGAPTLISVSTNGATYGVAVGDLNRDGKQDIVATTDTYNVVVVLLGKGDGSFQSPKNFSVANPTLNVAVADLNGDHALDLVLTDDNFVTVLLGNGDGTFQPEHDFSVSPGVSYGVFVSDLNQDGIPDIASTEYQSTGGNVVSVLLGNGDGTFQPYSAFAVGSGPVSVVGADFNSDGLIDLATANFAGNSVSVLLGNGDGTFEPQLEFKVNHGAIADDVGIAAADFNGDARPDLVAADLPGSSVLINSLAGISPTNNGFGTHLLGTSSSAPFTLSNVSNAALSISGVTITGTNSSDFSQSNNCGSSLPAGASCTISVKFTPTVAGARSASLNVSFPGAGSPQTASLNGYGTVVQLAPSKIDFGEVMVGHTSAAKTITLTNTGSQGVTIQFTGIAGTDKSDFAQTNNCPGFLPAGASCSLKVEFGTLTTGVHNAYLRIVDSGGGPFDFVPLKGTGI